MPNLYKKSRNLLIKLKIKDTLTKSNMGLSSYIRQGLDIVIHWTYQVTIPILEIVTKDLRSDRF